MEKFSSFKRVVGNIPEAKKEQILRRKAERFDDQVFEDLQGKERTKTPEELQIISLANEITNEVRQKYGLGNFDIPANNIHVIAEAAWPIEEEGVAFYNSMFQAVVMREKLSRIAFMATVFHEMLHFKSYNAAQITAGDNPELDGYRIGLTVCTRNGKKLYFNTLNEAITEEMTKRFVSKLFNHPLFAEEIRQTRNVVQQYPKAVTASDKPLFDGDTFYAESHSNKSWRRSVDRWFSKPSGSKVQISAESFTYKQARKLLNILIDKILERNSDKFQDREEVFEVFAKGMMTGNILPVGRLIERTFGNGTLRRIGELDQDMRTQEKFVNSL